LNTRPVQKSAADSLEPVTMPVEGGVMVVVAAGLAYHLVR
jgi:hypothetical protein